MVGVEGEARGRADLVHKLFLFSFLQTLLTKLCGQDRLLKRLQEEIDQRQEEKVQGSRMGRDT